MASKKDEKISPEDLREAIRLFKVRELHNLFGSFEGQQIPRKYGLVFAKNGLFKRDLRDNWPANFAEIISNPNHRKRKSSHLNSPEILVVESESSAASIDLADAILAWSRQIRKSAIAELLRMSNCHQTFWTRSTESLLVSRKGEIERADLSDFVDAAVAVSDALYHDFFYKNHCLRGGLEYRSEEVIDANLRFLLAPKLRTFGFLDRLPFRRPSFCRSEMASSHPTIADNQNSLSDICDKFYFDRGMLPLSGSSGLGAIVDSAIGESDDAAEVWIELNEWRMKCDSPLADFHFCQVFLYLPNLIPNDRANDFWSLMEALLLPMENENWKRFLEVANHYVGFLPSQVNGADGDITAHYALWFAGFLRLERRLTNGIFLEKINEVLKEMGSQINHAIEFGQPYVTRSSLYSAMINNESAFALAALRQLEQAHRQGVKVPKERMDAVARSILVNFTGVLSRHDCDGVFVCADVSSLMITLVFHHDDPIAISALSLLGQALSATLTKRLSDLLNETNGSVLQFVLSGIAGSDKLSVDQAKDLKILLRNPNQIESFANRVEVHTLKELVRVILTPVDDETDPDYWWQLPHLLLAAAEKVEDAKAEVFVDGMMSLALRTDAMGIIDRATQSRSELVKKRLAYWRDRMTVHRADLPNWAKSKVGSFIARLKV